MSENKENNPSIYFKSLALENVKCFKGEHKINFTDKNGNWAKWTVILGNNNTGKTTILKCSNLLCVQEYHLKDRSKKQYVLGYKYINSDELIFWLSNNAKQKKDKLFIETKTFFNYFNNESFIPPRDFGLSYSPENKNIPLTYYNHIYDDGFKNIQIYTYGISRKFSKTNPENDDKEIDPFSDDFRVINPEKWILNLHFTGRANPKADEYLERIRKLIHDNLLPDISDFEIVSKFEKGKTDNYVLFQTDFGKVRLEEMGYGYQVSLAWIMDLAKRMFERYPDAENPLEMPAIVLVDELDLHLHPEWQRKIISFLNKHFTKTQFIVTAHSPLLVQSAEEVNLVLLHKNGDSVEISQPDIQNFSGWTIEEILKDIMGLESRIYSERYLELIQQFDNALDTENYEEAKSAYDELDKILHPDSSQRKLMRIQMTSLTPETND